jgi:hypothetical protein
MTKNITFSAEERAIERAREKARLEHRTLNEAFRDWLNAYSGEKEKFDLDSFLNQFDHIKTGGPFTRDEMNER